MKWLWIILPLYLSSGDFLCGDELLESEFQMYSVNLYAFPKEFWFLNSGIKNAVKQRLDFVCNKIKSSQPDLINFQEIWGVENKKSVLENLKKYGYHTFFKDRNRYDLRYDSGLILAAKTKPMIVSHNVFEDARGTDAFSSKGFIIAVFKTKVRPLFIVNLHMQSDSNFLSSIVSTNIPEIQQKQFAQMIRRLHSVAFEQNLDLKNCSIILMGDFNCQVSNSKEKGLLKKTAFNNGDISDLLNFASIEHGIDFLHAIKHLKIIQKILPNSFCNFFTHQDGVLDHFLGHMVKATLTIDQSFIHKHISDHALLKAKISITDEQFGVHIDIPKSAL